MSEERDELEPPLDVVAVDTAALAANSAERAAGAAQDAIVHAEIAAADVAHQAAETIAEAQEEQDQWRTRIQSSIETLEAESSRVSQSLTDSLAGLEERISSMQAELLTRLPPLPSPPDPTAGGEGHTEAPREAAAEPPEEPTERPPPRPRAHRWI